MVGDAIAQEQTTFAIFEDASNISGYGLNFFFCKNGFRVFVENTI